MHVLMLPVPSSLPLVYRRHSGEEAVEEDDGKKSKRHRSDKDRSSDKRDDDDRFVLCHTTICTWVEDESWLQLFEMILCLVAVLAALSCLVGSSSTVGVKSCAHCWSC